MWDGDKLRYIAIGCSFIKGSFKTAFCQGPDKTGNQKQDRKLIDTIACFYRIIKKTKQLLPLFSSKTFNIFLFGVPQIFTYSGSHHHQ